MEFLWKKVIVLSASTPIFKSHYSYVFRKQVMISMMIEIRNPCKVTLPNYKYFQKRMNPYTPDCRGLYLGYHVSCQAVLKDNSYTQFSFFKQYYYLWNHS